MNHVEPPWWLAPMPVPDARVAVAARARQDSLTKPPGALGELEALAVRLAAMQGRERPSAERVWIAVFAGDHGVAAEGVSAFPQAVTAEMVKNFARGGAAISVLARSLDARLEVVNLGTVAALPALAGVVDQPLGPGTANLARAPAMTPAQCAAALAAGRASVARARAADTHIYVGGEMGIANTTAAAALACALLGEAPTRLAGPGTGLDTAGVARKATVIAAALALHGYGAGAAPDEAVLEALRRLGGFEIAALAGAYLACAQAGLPVLVDGFISSVAALVAQRLAPACAPWLLYGHASAEPGHARVLQALAARPLLSLGMRLGEASGAAVAIPLLRLACRLHDEMATFAEAGVSGA